MSTPNEDALLSAGELNEIRTTLEGWPGAWSKKTTASANQAEAHIRRPVAENQAQAALLLQALDALDGVHAGEHQGGVEEAAAAIRKHFEGKASTAPKTNPTTN